MTDAQILSTDYFQFFDSTTVNGSFGMNHFSSDDTLKTAMYSTGTFRAVGADFIFFLGNGSWGTVITTTSGYAYGSSAVLPITTQNPTNASMAAYGSCSGTPAAAVGTIPVTTTSTTTIPVTTTSTSTTTTTIPVTTTSTTTTTIPVTTTTTTTTTIPVTTTSTTTTTIAPAITTTTTVAPATTASSSVPTATVATLPAPTPSGAVVASTTAPAQASTVTAPQVLSPGVTTTTTPIRATSSNATATTAAGSIPTTTTVAPTTTTTVATKNVAPLAEDAVSSVPQDQAVALINGKSKKVLVIRTAAKMQASVGTVVMGLTARTSDGSPILLDADGNLLVQPGDVVELRLAGLLSASESEVWLYSTPENLGTVLVGADGEASFDYTVPTSLEAGTHRVVLSGKSVLGDTVNIGLPLRAVESEKSGGNVFSSNPLIWLVLGLFVVIGLFLPSQIRRRRL